MLENYFSEVLTLEEIKQVVAAGKRNVDAGFDLLNEIALDRGIEDEIADCLATATEATA